MTDETELEAGAINDDVSRINFHSDFHVGLAYGRPDARFVSSRRCRTPITEVPALMTDSTA